MANKKYSGGEIAYFYIRREVLYGEWEVLYAFLGLGIFRGIANSILALKNRARADGK
jgi:hypothetical protein